MPTTLKRMTVVLTPDIEVRLDETKKEEFYNCSYSEMMRTLIIAGLNSLDIENEKSEQQKEGQKATA